MSTHAVVTTADDLYRLPTGEGKVYELIEGQLRVMCAAGFEHGRVASTAGYLLAVHVRTTGSGVTLGAETGFILGRDPDTVRAPDAAFVSNARVAAIGITPGFWPGGAPDLAIEVVSPDDSQRYVREKALNWLDAGAAAVLVLDPRTRSATVYRPGGAVTAHEDGTLDLSDAVPGWRVALADFFA
ncbi:MAG TPA: Uma2 family endonuclease [Solirubrobacteraceae bacterium]|jgi:Uma2 family endonuclease|nr:Uma2 family endonuclease [Solirubrobacteraceae bacterium]